MEDHLDDPTGDPILIEEFTAHLESLFGEIEQVLHESDSSFVHVDVYQLSTEGDLPQTYFTTGMAERAMNVPSDCDHLRHAELLLHLDPSWPRDFRTPEGGARYWPIGNLIQLARFPHAAETWLGPGHTIGDPSGTPFPGTGYTDVLIMEPILLDEEDRAVTLSDGRVVGLLNLVFLYPEEAEYARSHGSSALYQAFAGAGIHPDELMILRPERRSPFRTASA